MNYKIISYLLIVIGLNGCASNSKPAPESQAQPTTNQASSINKGGTLLIKTITFDKDAHIREAVKKECNLITKLTQFINENADAQYQHIITDSNNIPQAAQILQITIKEVYGGGGGAWSGAKSVLIKGTLTQSGKTLGNFEARRVSGGGMFAMYKGTCSILGRCVRTLGQDVAKWLMQPTANAALGNM